MVNVASLMKNAKPEEQNKDTPSVTEQNKAIASAPVEQNDIPSVPNVPADAKATTATSDGKVDIGTDKVKDASADVKATPVDYKYDKATGSYKTNTGNAKDYEESDDPEVDNYNLLADMIEAGDAEGAMSLPVSLATNTLFEQLNVSNPTPDNLKSAIKNLTAKQRNSIASALRSTAALMKGEKGYKPSTPTVTNTKNTMATPAPVATATSDIKPTTATTPATDKTTPTVTPTPATDTATPAEPTMTPEERHQKVVEYTKNFLDSNILEGKKPEDINWTDKKVTDNITTNYNILDDEHKAEAEKQLAVLAAGSPEAEAAVKEAIINAKSNKFSKFWRDAGKWVVDKAHWLYDNRLSSNKQTFDEWINDNPSVLTSIFGNSGLNFGERLGNAVGLAAAMTSDIFKGVYEGANNMANSGPTSTKAFIEPYKSIAAKNIEQIVKNKEGTTEATAEQAKDLQKTRALKIAKYLPNDDLDNILALKANPDADLSKIYADDTMWHKAYMKANPKVKEEDIDTKYAADFLNFKQNGWNDLMTTLSVDKGRLENTKALQDIESQNISIANQVHELGVNRFKDWNDIEQGLLKQKQDLIQLRNKAAVADKAQLIELAKSYKDLMTGLSSTSSTTGATTAGTTTSSSTNVVGGNAGANIKLAEFSGKAEHSGSKMNAETSSNNNAITVTSDANTDAVMKYASDPKLITDLAAAKKQYIDSIDSMIRYIDLALNQAKSLREAEAASSSVTSSDARLKNLIDTGHYVAGSDYYRALLSVI